jgi:hypothetical protein
MHDLAATPTGAVKSATAIAIEIMILLNIDMRIAQVRPRVEERIYRPSSIRAHVHAFLVRCSVRSSAHQVARPTFSAETADATAADFR